MSGSSHGHGVDLSGDIETSERIYLDQPKKYKVILHNDDYTPMDFVVDVLAQVFRKTETEATKIMLDVHKKGAGVCGIYSYEIAETKVELVHHLAETNEFPLKATMEEV